MKKIPYRYAVALTAALGLFMAVLDNTIVNVALTAMQKSFHTDINTIQWVITAYFLTQAAVIPVAGYLALRFGLKQMYVLALGLFSLGSFMCGLTPHIVGSGGEKWIIAFRVLQGLGGGMLFPLATSISFGVFPPAERAKSSAVIALPVLLAPTLGPTIGGLIVDSAAGWPWMFFINVPVGIVAMVLFSRIYRPGVAGAARARSGFDLVGLLLSVVGVVLVVYAFTVVSQTRPGTISSANPQGTVYGFGYWLVWALFGAGLAVLAAFSVYETRVVKDPVLDLRLFRSYTFTVSNILTWVVRAVVFGSFFLLPLYLQQFRGLSATQAGLALLPQGLAAAVAIVTGSRLYDRVGPRALVFVGMAALVVSSWMLAHVALSETTTARDLIPSLVVRGLGFGWANLPLQTLALSALTGRALPKASSLFNATAQIFSSIGVAVLSTLFIQRTLSHAHTIAGTAVSAGRAAPHDVAVRAATSSSIDVFTYVAIATAVAAVASLLLPSRSLARVQQDAPEGATQGRTAVALGE